MIFNNLDLSASGVKASPSEVGVVAVATMIGVVGIPTTVDARVHKAFDVDDEGWITALPDSLIGKPVQVCEMREGGSWQWVPDVTPFDCRINFHDWEYIEGSDQAHKCRLCGLVSGK